MLMQTSQGVIYRCLDLTICSSLRSSYIVKVKALANAFMNMSSQMSDCHLRHFTQMEQCKDNKNLLKMKEKEEVFV